MVHEMLEWFKLFFFIYADNVVCRDLLGFRLDLCWLYLVLKDTPIEFRNKFSVFKNNSFFIKTFFLLILSLPNFKVINLALVWSTEWTLLEADPKCEHSMWLYLSYFSIGTLYFGHSLVFSAIHLSVLLVSWFFFNHFFICWKFTGTCHLFLHEKQLWCQFGHLTLESSEIFNALKTRLQPVLGNQSIFCC